MANNSTNSRFANTGPPQTKKSGGPGPPGPPGSDAYGCNTKQYKMNTDELTVGSRVGISCTCSGWLSTDAAISSLYTAQFKHRYNYQTALCFHAWLTDRQTDNENWSTKCLSLPAGHRGGSTRVTGFRTRWQLSTRTFV